MLGTPKALGEAIEGKAVSRSKARWPEERSGLECGGKCKRNYGRLARSDEYSPGVAISGRESGHAVQVRGRAENSRIQIGQPLALQKIAAGPVDGRQVKRDGTAGKTQTEGGHESCRVTVVKTARATVPAPHKKGGTCLEWDRSP